MARWGGNSDVMKRWRRGNGEMVKYGVESGPENQQL